MANLNLLLLFILSISSSMIFLASSSTTTSSKFLQCFINKTNSTNNIYTPNTNSYTNVLLSSVQNTRFITSNTTTKPSFIITAATFSDVQASITCSRLAGLHVRVRSGGHDYEAMSYVSSGDPFITIDLANLRSITVDKAQGTAWVQAGATIGELYYTIAKNNRTVAFPAGICPTVGVGGHFTGGGIGSLTRTYGTSADNIVDALIVNSKGKLMNRKAMGEDLFWAIRGGGGASFGVVLSFKIKLVSVPSTVTVFNVNRNLGENATELVERWQTIAPKFDEKLFIRVVAQAANGGTTIQAVFNSFYLGKIDELLPVMKKSFPELGLKREDCTEVSWLESVLFFNGDLGKSVDVLLDREPQVNSSFKAKSDFVKNSISKEGLEKIWKFLLEAKDEPLILILEPFGGKMDEILEPDIAFPHRKGNLYNIQYYMSWSESGSAVSEKHLEWMRKMYEFMTPYVSSQPRAAYYNYKDIDLGAGRGSYLEDEVWGVKYFKGNFKRLALVKGMVDPENFFRNEQSIPSTVLFKQYSEIKIAMPKSSM
ncbi:Tetrahydroberberine oxidase protein [Dioscorea alata]|uniref:Tetrahydroberberine oxidase protein n=1 Tax=Dioscorea alata TaxID=55571 RepID=A0ACB7U289_DIOAL|nr:Tetrahydroberberine oxidase protein [Dioscorea alata]